MNNKPEEEFYIGYLPKAPTNISRFLKIIISGIFLFVIVLAIFLAMYQKPFPAGVFEFGNLTELTGQYTSHPIPSIRIVNGKDFNRTEIYTTIPLVGYGKSGPVAAIKQMEINKESSLEGKTITLGTLIYADGKTLLELTQEASSLVSVHGTAENHVFDSKPLGITKLQGEIIDPKCNFGVMKPNTGKVHRDCAVRCLSGGIPAMLSVTDNNGSKHYYILLDKNGNSMNKELLAYVGEHVEIIGDTYLFGDWMTLNLDGIQSIRRIN